MSPPAPALPRTDAPAGPAAAALGDPGVRDRARGRCYTAAGQRRKPP